MTPRTRNVCLFLLFFLSGFCGLAYQVVWLRLAYASFGIITPVMSVVISVFMLGLALGSWLSGRGVERWTRRTGLSAIHFYALAEVAIATGAFAVPPLFRAGARALLPLGDMGSATYLGASGVILGLSILPFCLAMGATYPLMLGFVREVDRSETRHFSFLYFANTVGAMAGVLVTAVALIELLGLAGTLAAAAGINVVVAASAVAIGLAHGRPVPGGVKEAPSEVGADVDAGSATPPRFALVVLFATGFCSMGLEVVWVRAFTPILGTRVYSFALLLFAYLLATWLGAGLYRRHLARGAVAPVSSLLAVLAATTFLPVLFSDPRINTYWLYALISIAPLSATLGYLTPQLVDEYSRGRPAGAGAAYALNVLGSILGPLLSAYVVLPWIGPRLGIALLSLPFVVLFLLGLSRGTTPRGFATGMGAAAAAGLLLTLFVNVGFEEGPVGSPSEIRRDHTATVVSYGSGMDKQLEVNGAGLTKLTSVAKFMGHLPMAFVERPPESALVICFGMGTTFRSLASWDARTTAVELAGGVVDAFPFYFEDAEELLAQRELHVAVDDGRRFLQRTPTRWDVITIDPPPPIEAAGSSLLYSTEFLELVRERLAPGGVLHHWVPPGEKLIHSAVARGLTETFPHLRAFRAWGGHGIHFIASETPLQTPSPELFLERTPPEAVADLMEWDEVSAGSARALARMVLNAEIDPRTLLVSDPGVVITDDRPFNEYYLMRRIFP